MEYLIDYKEPNKVNKRKRTRNRKKQRIEILSEGNRCVKCQQPMQRRRHREIGDKQLNKAYYFSEWDYCPACKHVQHYDKFKVFNKNDKAKRVKEYIEFREKTSWLNSF